MSESTSGSVNTACDVRTTALGRSNWHMTSTDTDKWCIMATVKKRKVDAECRVFQEKWTNYFFFVEVKGKPVCLVCGEALAVMKKANVERHYSSKHAKLDELKGQMRLDKINALRLSLGAQQAAFTRPQTDRENITRATVWCARQPPNGNNWSAKQQRAQSQVPQPFSAGLLQTVCSCWGFSHPEETCPEVCISVWDNVSLWTVLFKTDSCKDSLPLKTDWLKLGKPASSSIIITASRHQTPC